MTTEFDLEEELKKLPDSPGVYIMHDAADTIIYVGKAVSLTKRVHQYFQKSHNEGIKKARMVENIAYFEYIITDTELEALVLECNLIKEHRPKYNTMLRDDKTYPYIKITVDEMYPRVLFSRTQKKDKARYFGPFTSAGAVNETIDLIEKAFNLRTCNKVFPRDFKKERPCLNYDMKQCKGVCSGKVTVEEYEKGVKAAIELLSGNDKTIIKDLEKKMEDASSALDFENAARYRDLIASVRHCVEKQKITDHSDQDRDIVALSSEGEDAVAQVFFIRNGRMIGREHFFINIREDEDRSAVLEAFIKQYYSGTPLIPAEIDLSDDIKDTELLSDYLSKRRGKKVNILVPSRGQKKKLTDLARKNAYLVLSQDKEKIKKEEGRTIGAMKEISDLLNIPGIMRLEAYDISNTSGYQSVGSMVVFEKGKPLRSDYRKFRLRTVEGPNDYASMREVLTRRFTHGIREREEGDKADSAFTRFPDVIMMDGGRGQVNIALSVLSELKLDIPVCGMVKDDHHRTRGLYFNNKEIPIDKTGEGFKLITRLQDEAHRFAITYHKSLRGKNQTKSFLDDIKGIGEKRRKALMREFSSLLEMKEKSIEELSAVPSMDKKSAKAVYDFLHKEEQEGKEGE